MALLPAVVPGYAQAPREQQLFDRGWGMAGYYVHQFGELLVYSGPGGNRIAPRAAKVP